MFIQSSITLPDIIQGGTWDPVVILKDKDTGALIPLGAWIGANKGARLQLRVESAPTTGSPVAEVGCTIVGDGTSAQIQLMVHAVIAKAITPGPLVGDIELFDNSGANEIVRKPTQVRTTCVKEFTLP